MVLGISSHARLWQTVEDFYVYFIYELKLLRRRAALDPDATIINKWVMRPWVAAFSKPAKVQTYYLNKL